MRTDTAASPLQALDRLGGKIRTGHLDRLAVVYVRQSTMQQVDRHQESTRLQYALVDRAIALGCARSQVIVIDEDLGHSGSTTEGRPGFQRLVAEVGLDHVGLVLGIEISRLARSSRDWYQLLEVCAVFATLIADADGLYDPTSYNDRLLLGLKGTMSEAELHVLKQRMLEGKRAKARRGELALRLPMGYLRHPSGEVMKDPDEQARAVIETVFEQFERRGTLNAVLRYLVEHDLRLPYRLPGGVRKGEIDWRRPARMTLSNLLRNPTYAGAYVYGRRPVDPRRKIPGRPATGRTTAPAEHWEGLLKDRFPAYITWAQYERNLDQLQSNTAQGGGVVRKGPSLLSGLLICGRCGLRMATQYNKNCRGLRYTCSRMAVDYGEPLCQSLAGEVLDEEVRRLVFAALQPAALDISLQVSVFTAWRSRLRLLCDVATALVPLPNPARFLAAWQCGVCEDGGLAAQRRCQMLCARWCVWLSSLGGSVVKTGKRFTKAPEQTRRQTEALLPGSGQQLIGSAWVECATLHRQQQQAGESKHRNAESLRDGPSLLLVHHKRQVALLGQDQGVCLADIQQQAHLLLKGMVRHCNDPKKTGTAQGLLPGRITGKPLRVDNRRQEHGLEAGPEQIQPSLSVEDDQNGGVADDRCHGSALGRTAALLGATAMPSASPRHRQGRNRQRLRRGCRATAACPAWTGRRPSRAGPG